MENLNGVPRKFFNCGNYLFSAIPCPKTNTTTTPTQTSNAKPVSSAETAA